MYFRLRHRRRKFWPWALLGTAVLYLAQANLTATVLAISRVEAQQLATRVLAQAIQQKMVAEARSTHLFRVELLAHQAIIQPNTMEINRLASQASLAIQEGLRNLSRERIRIPLGQALGSRLLAGYGPGIPVTLLPYGSASVNIGEDLRQAGINQTVLLVYLDTDTTVRIVVPFTSQEIHLRLKIPLAQEWYAGEVPGTFLSIPGQVVGGFRS